MDDLIVIVLTLIVAVVGIIGQTKKKRQSGAQPQTGKASPNFWEMLEPQIEPEEQFEDNNEFIEEEASNFIVENNIVDVVPPAKSYTFNAYNEGASSKKEKTILEIIEADSKKTKREKFPLRKAVIYSEILNRKYM